MVFVSSAKVFREIITWRRNNSFNFSPKGKNGVENAICAPGVKACHILYCGIRPRLKFFQIDLIVFLKSRSKQQIRFDSVSVTDNLAAI